MTDTVSKYSLTLKHIFYLSLGGFGLQLVSSLELNNTSGLFKFLGTSDKQISWLWLIAPLAGLIVQPTLGQISDLVQTRYGRRIPFIFGSMVFACISLVFLAFSESLQLTAMMILILSCSINGGTEALRALIGDLAPNKQKATAFAWQSVLGGVGAMLASAIPWLLDSLLIFIPVGSNGIKIPVILKVALLIGAILLFQSLMIMFREVKEKNFNVSNHQVDSVQYKNYFNLLYLVWRELLINFINMPQVIKRFFMVQIFTWAGMFCIWLYFGIALAQHVFGMPVNVNIVGNHSYQVLLKQAFIESGICFTIYQLVSIVYALLLPWLTKRFSPYKIHAISLLVGAISLLSIGILDSMYLIYFTMIGIGILWGSLCTMPYAIISAELPSDKMGTYLGLFNTTITIPQIICGLLIGVINQYIFLNHAIISLLLAGVMIGIAGVILLRQEGVDIVQLFYIWLRKILQNVQIEKT